MKLKPLQAYFVCEGRKILGDHPGNVQVQIVCFNKLFQSFFLGLTYPFPILYSLYLPVRRKILISICLFPPHLRLGQAERRISMVCLSRCSPELISSSSRYSRLLKDRTCTEKPCMVNGRRGKFPPNDHKKV